MKPLNISENNDNEEMTLSFLPSAPVAHVKVPKRRKKKSSFAQCFLKYALLTFAICGIIGVKYFSLTSSVHSRPVTRKWNDLDLNDIENWCLQPNTTSCKCVNPLHPAHRHGHKTWTQAHHDNVRFAKNNMPKKSPFRELDVVFFGDSITEGWRGTSFGQAVEKKQNNTKVFEGLFDMDSGGDYDGLVLGIAGDKSPNLLWRLQHGEMPKNLKSKVFWLLIGTNDFLKENNCSEEVVIMGIERVIEEMLSLRPTSTIVVNGLLPRATGSENGELYKKNEKNLMDAIDTVNRQLKEFCSSRNDLVYFDATELFVEEDLKIGKGRYAKFIPKELMEDRLHPTALGYEKWGKEIVKELEKILEGQLTFER